MFDKITIDAKSYFSKPGILAESLLFYQKTNLIVDAGSISSILGYCGYENLVELIKSNELEIKYNSTALGAGNVKDDLFMITSFESKNHKKFPIINQAVKDVYGNSIRSTNIATHLNRIIQQHSYSDNYHKLLKEELANKENIVAAIKLASKGRLGNDDISIFNIEKVKNGIYNIETNLDNGIIRDAAFLISTGTGEIYNSEIYKSAIVTETVKSNYAEDRLNRVINLRKKDERQIQNFHEFELPEYFDLQGTINSGAKDFQEYMEIWREARKFKEWLKNEKPDIELLTKYTRKVKENTWLDKLDVKNARWLIFAAIGTLLGGKIGGLAGTVASLGTDYFDDLILGSLLKNWKPNQFVDRDYKDFLNLRI